MSSDILLGLASGLFGYGYGVFVGFRSKRAAVEAAYQRGAEDAIRQAASW